MDQVFTFLLGEGPLDGQEFGGGPPIGEGPLWWRKALRVAMDRMEAVDIGNEATVHTSRMIDASYPLDMPLELRLHRRSVTKLAEELGEVAEALGGVLGENPRKGRTHTMPELIEELLDVAAVALGAVVSIHDAHGHAIDRPLDLLARQINEKRWRLAAILDGGAK